MKKGINLLRTYIIFNTSKYAKAENAEVYLN